MKTFFLLFLILFVPSQIQGQLNSKELGFLPSEVEETSGLLVYNGNLITHNDSGHEPILYVLDTASLAIRRQVKINNVLNVDWEDLAQDESFIYIGDFGNNKGTREDLAVHKISKKDFDQFDEITAQTISFKYSDQDDFSGEEATNWDAEALVAIEEKLIVFTKQWQSRGTSAYSIPKEAGSHTALYLDSYAIDGLVTGADYSGNLQELIVIGYSQLLIPFVSVFGMSTTGNIFGEYFRKKSLGKGIAQIEGVAINTDGDIFISSERYRNQTFGIAMEASVLMIPSQENEESSPDVEEEYDEENHQVENDPELPENQAALQIHHSLIEDHVFVTANDSLVVREIYLFDAMGRQLDSPNVLTEIPFSMDVSRLSSGLFFLTLITSEGIVHKSFLRL